MSKLEIGLRRQLPEEKLVGGIPRGIILLIIIHPRRELSLQRLMGEVLGGIKRLLLLSSLMRQLLI